jgi:arylsulfatase A-like enzyme
MNRRGFLAGAAAAAAARAIVGCRTQQRGQSHGGSPPGPNLIFFLTDDQRWDTLGCMGNRVIQTPNVDRLAARGVVFDNTFVTTSICCCSRASIFTGQYTRRHGIVDFATPLAPRAFAQTYPEILRQAGYRVGFVGKFGVDDPHPMKFAPGFDYMRPMAYGGRYLDPKDPSAPHTTAVSTQDALGFLGTCGRGRPFCLSVSYRAPHAIDGPVPNPYPCEAEFAHLYEDVEIPASPLATAADYGALPPFLRKSEARVRWQHRFATPEAFQRNARNYYRLITGIDASVGRILARVDEMGLAAGTVVIFMSDNGYYLGDRGLSDKWFMHEESIRVPLVICDPRMPASMRGRRVSAMALNIDLAPTMLDLAGLPAPPAMQGLSLAPALRSEGFRTREDWFYEHLFKHAGIPKCEGVRTERWKYVRWIETQPLFEELYDLRADPFERRNLAADAACAEVLGELRGRWAYYSNAVR